MYSATLLGSATVRLGLARSIVLGALLMAVGVALLPLLRTVDDYAVWPRPLLVALPDALAGIGFMHCFTACVAAFNTAVARQDRAHSGALHGIAAACMAAAMAVGPLLASPAFAAAIHTLPPPAATANASISGGRLTFHDAVGDGASAVLGGLALVLLCVAVVGSCNWSDLVALQPPHPTQSSAIAASSTTLDGANSDSERLPPPPINAAQAETAEPRVGPPGRQRLLDHAQQ